MKGPVRLRERFFAQSVVLLPAAVPFVALAGCGGTSTTSSSTPTTSGSSD